LFICRGLAAELPSVESNDFSAFRNHRQAFGPNRWFIFSDTLATAAGYAPKEKTTRSGLTRSIASRAIGTAFGPTGYNRMCSISTVSPSKAGNSVSISHGQASLASGSPHPEVLLVPRINSRKRSSPVRRKS
jgi:hypothetical protein